MPDPMAGPSWNVGPYGLGVGFTLATHDMEIRGAGELLGEDQSGQIQSIGFSLYMDMLDPAVTQRVFQHVRENVVRRADAVCDAIWG